MTDDNYNIPTFIVSMRLETNFKGSKLIKSKVTAYDDNRDRFVTKYVRVYLRQDDNGSYGFDNEKKEVFYIEDPNYQGFRYSKYIELENGEVKLYNGYEETSFIDSELAQNYLANSDNFTTVDTGWYFDTLTDVREEQAKLMSG
jgi:hypothetical protein